jgi:hypothetical protein
MYVDRNESHQQISEEVTLNDNLTCGKIPVIPGAGKRYNKEK